LQEGGYDDVIRTVEAGLEEIRSFLRDYGRPDHLESSNEVGSLENWLREIRAKRPMSERERLECALEEAVRREDYEKAAQVRDALRNLKTSAP
jgi:excinuclease UvrABC helicase subunit UvrB